MVTAEESESPLTESKSVVLPVTLRRSIARLFRAVNQAFQTLFSPKLHIAGMTITHSPLASWTFGFTLCSHSLFNCLTHRGCLIFLSRIVPSAANLSCLSFRAVKHISPCLVFSQGRWVLFELSRSLSQRRVLLFYNLWSSSETGCRWRRECGSNTQRPYTSDTPPLCGATLTNLSTSSWHGLK